MKRRGVILAVLLLPVIFVTYFFSMPATPLLIFRQMNPAAYSVGSNELQWQIELKNNSDSKELYVWYTFQKSGSETRPPALNDGGTWIPPRQHIITGPVTSTDSKDECRLIVVFPRQSRIEKMIRAKFGKIPILRNFLQASKTNVTPTSEWFRIPPPPTNGWPPYPAGGKR